jgi:ribosomal protein L37AE/L43A
MWKCLDCGASFVEPEVQSWSEDHGGFWEDWNAEVCPFCGSDEIERQEVDYD